MKSSGRPGRTSPKPTTAYDDEEVDAGYINYGQRPAAGTAGRRPAGPSLPRFRRALAAAEAGPPAPAAGVARRALLQAALRRRHGGVRCGGAAPASPDTAPQETAPQPTAPQPLQDGAAYRRRRAGCRSVSPPPAEEPKVSLWSGDDYDDDAGHRSAGAPGHRIEHRVPSPMLPRTTAGTGRNPLDRAPGNFPASARNHGSADDDDYYEKDDEPRREPRSMRWLVGGLLAAVLVVGMIFAVTNLGSLFKSSPPPAADGTSSSSTPSQSSAPPSGTAKPCTRGGAAGDRRRHPAGQLRFRGHV